MKRIAESAIIEKNVQIGENVVIKKNAKIGKGTIIKDNCIIGENSILGANSQLEEFAIIKHDTKLGENTKVDHHAVIGPYVIAGNGNYFGMFCYIGGDPQDVDYENKISYIKIGNNNIIREYVTIHRGSKEGSETIVGNNNFMMAYSHMGHNAKIGDNNVITNTAQLAGYSQLGNYVVMSAFTAIHQFCKVGDYVMIGGGAKVNKDIPPYSIAFGTPAKVIGLNIVGLRRRGFSAEQRERIKNIYDIFYHQGLTFSKAIKVIDEKFGKFDDVKFSGNANADGAKNRKL